jgi:hypothetical protein
MGLFVWESGALNGQQRRFPARAVAAVSLAWHKAGCSCGIRGLCDAKRAVGDRVAARLQAKALKARWQGDGGRPPAARAPL